MPVPRPTELIPTTKVLSEQVAKADVALVTLGRTSGEFVDRNVSDFELSEEELQLLKSVSQAFPCCWEESGGGIEYRRCNRNSFLGKTTGCYFCWLGRQDRRVEIV